MNSLSKILLFAVLVAGSAPGFGQVRNDDAPKTVVDTNGVEEVIIGKVRYKTVINWATFGPGISENRFGPDGSLAFDYHITTKKGLYYQFGIMRGKELHGFFPPAYTRLFNQIHAGIGLKKQGIKYLYAGFAGPSLGVYEYVESNRLYTYKPIGLFVNVEFVYKPVYDVGIGTDLFVEINPRYTFGGARLIIFLSNAYKKGR